MEQILKAAEVVRQSLGEDELALINRQALRELSAEEVFVFRLASCDNQVDRDFERFTDQALQKLAPLFVGKSVLMDHDWSTGAQTARVYAAGVEDIGTVKRLILRCYMPRTEKNASIIDSIEAGILRECSVGCAMNKVVCNICGADQTKTCCQHQAGREYDGKLCVMSLDEPKDAFEVSMVAVPSQRNAGVVKSKRYGGIEAPENPVPPPGGEEPKSIIGRLAKMAHYKNNETEE